MIMRTLLKIYSASCFILIGFVLFFMIPFEALPFSSAVTGMLFGGIILAIIAAYVFWIHKNEGFEFGWFLAIRGGFWIITLAFFALLVFLGGLMLFIVPQAVEPAFESGAMPAASMLVVLFWLALIFMFGFLSFVMIARTTALVRMIQIKKFFGSLAVAAICLVMAAVFFSLFVEVINDIFIHISVSAQWTAIWIFVGALVVAGIFHGSRKEVSHYLEDGELKTGQAHEE